MTIYTAYTDSTKIEFTDINDRDNFVLLNSTYKKGEYEIEVTLADVAFTSEERYYKDMEFGERLVKEFLMDNRNSVIAFTPETSLNLLNKFAGVEALCRLGDVQNVRVILPMIEVDTVFTQERKNKYVAMVEEYMVSIGL